MDQNILIFDTETIGLPKFKKNFTKKTSNGNSFTSDPFNDYHNPSQSEFYDPSRLIELGYQIYNPKKELLVSKSLLVKPDGFIIRNSDIHGIEHSTAVENGRPILEVLTEFSNDLNECNTMVAHNLPFDYFIVLSECFRFDLENTQCAKNIINKFKYMSKFCTMNDAMKIMQLTKRPKLSILYKDLLSKEWEQIHRAEDDARACAECYWKLLDIQKENYTRLANI